MKKSMKTNIILVKNEYVLPSTENIEIYKQKIKESIDRIIHPIYGEQNEGKGEL